MHGRLVSMPWDIPFTSGGPHLLPLSPNCTVDRRRKMVECGEKGFRSSLIFWLPPSPKLYSRQMKENAGMWKERIQVVVDYFDFLCHQIVQGYTMHVHTAGGRKGIRPVRPCCWLWKRYTLHAHTAGSENGYTLHVLAAAGGKWYTLHAQTARSRNWYTVHLKEVEGDTPFTSIDGCCRRKVSSASAFLPAFTFFQSVIGILDSPVPLVMD